VRGYLGFGFLVIRARNWGQWGIVLSNIMGTSVPGYQFYTKGVLHLGKQYLGFVR
jgi:hypothetical protein